MQIRRYYLLCELQLHLVLDRHAFEFHTALLLQSLGDGGDDGFEVALGEEVASVAGDGMVLGDGVEA